MKFIELKKRLQEKVDNVYLISGCDRFLCFKALEQISGKLDLQLPDMNSVTMTPSLKEAGSIPQKFHSVVWKGKPL